MYVIKVRKQDGQKKWEQVDVAITEPEANRLVRRYQTEYGTGWQVKATKRGGGIERGEYVNEGFI